MDVGGDGGLLHLAVAGGDAAVADVVLNGVVEEHRVLRDHADVRSQRRLLHLGEGKGRKRRPLYCTHRFTSCDAAVHTPAPSICPGRRWWCSLPERHRSGRWVERWCSCQSLTVPPAGGDKLSLVFFHVTVLILTKKDTKNIQWHFFFLKWLVQIKVFKC